MSQAQAESVIKSIIREINQECALRGPTLSETLVAFMVKAVVLDPKNEFNVDRKLTSQDVQKLVELCVDKLMQECSPALDTIKMQVFFDMNYTSRREFVEEHQRVLQARLSPLCREITEVRVKTQEELQALYSTITSFVLLRSGLGPPSDVNTVRETTAALQSIFPQQELGTFMSLAKKDKVQQLNELTSVVMGIRLFNKFLHKGGESIDDLPAFLGLTLPAASHNAQQQMEQSQRLAWKCTALLERAISSEAEQEESDPSLTLLKQSLYNLRQHETFLKVILADLSQCSRQVELLQTDLTSRMSILTETVQFRTAVPTALVFPHFTVLGELWKGFQDEMLLLSILDNIAATLQPYLAAQSQLFPEKLLDDMLQGSEVKTDEQRVAESADDRVDPSEATGREWFHPDTVGNFDKLPLQYRGTCGYTLVNKEGLLLPGNPSIGVLKHRGKFYAFSSKDAALSFSSLPEVFISRVAEKAKSSPELIQLLQLHQQFSCFSSSSECGQKILAKPIATRDSGTQTDTHLVETNMVVSYEWNEWELRRKAIKLANLRSTVTHSMQTDLSHLRRENCSQTFLPRPQASQTKRDGHSNVPRPQVYLAGLRGQRDGRLIKTNLTRPISE